MPLPVELIDKIRDTCLAQGIDADESVRAMRVLVGDDACVEYSVWGGPGFGQETVKLDVYVLGRSCLYNYCVRDENMSSVCSFLDDIHSTGIVSVPHEKSPYVLAIWTDSEKSRIFGGPDDKLKLEAFRQKIIVAALTAKER